jgi:adiponectin receptor
MSRNRKVSNAVDDWISGDCKCELHITKRRNPYLFNSWYGQKKEYLTLEEIPEYEKSENPYILTGYRSYYNTWQCVKSIFAWHNETMNIWTQLVFFLWDFYEFFYEPWDLCITWIDTFMVLLGYFGRWSMLLTSFMFHTMAAHYCPDVVRFFNKLDFVGIVALQGAVNIESYYVMLYQEQMHSTLLNTILLLMTSLSIITIFLVFDKRFTTNEYRIYLMIMLVLLGVFGGLALIGCFVLIFEDRSITISVYDMFVASFFPVLSISIGVTMYMNLLPERFFPGKFDYMFNSHNFHHLFGFLSIYGFKRITSPIRVQRLENMALMKRIIDGAMNIPNPIYRLGSRFLGLLNKD